MLGKLLKYEIKSQAKSLFAFWMIILASGLLVRVFSLIQEKAPLFQYLTMIAILTFIIAIILGIAYCFFLAIKNFYKKVLREEGYLTNTLPVKKNSILFSFVLTAVLFMILTIVISLIGCMIAFYEPTAMENMWNLLVTFMEQEFQMNVEVAISTIIGFMIFAYTNTTLMIYAAMTIGHSFAQNKIPSSIGVGVAFYMVYQVLNIIGVILIIAINHSDLFALIESDEVPIRILVEIFAVTGINMLILMITSYVLTNRFLKNRLNLE